MEVKDKRTGITYVYESESYWDKEKKQPRARRKLIGKIDEATGEIVPTDGRGRKRKNPQEGPPDTAAGIMAEAQPDYASQLQQKEDRITQLEAENHQLRDRLEAILSDLGSIQQRYKIPGQ